MDIKFRELQRQFYTEPTVEVAQKYICMLERLCGFGPLPEIRATTTKLGKLLQQQTEHGIDTSALRRERLDEQFDKLEALLLQTMHKHRPNALTEDHLYIESSIRYKFLGGDPPFRYKIVRSRSACGYYDEGSLTKKKKALLTSLGASLRPKEENRRYGSPSKGTVVYQNVPSLDYYAVSSLPNSEDALIRIPLYQETDKELVASLLNELLTG